MIDPCISSILLLDYSIGSNFWKFYLIKTSFTLGEPVSSVKVFRPFTLEQIFFGVDKMLYIYLLCSHSAPIGLVINTPGDNYKPKPWITKLCLGSMHFFEKKSMLQAKH
jgi:hypothetical protein